MFKDLKFLFSKFSEPKTPQVDNRRLTEKYEATITATCQRLLRQQEILEDEIADRKERLEDVKAAIAAFGSAEISLSNYNQKHNLNLSLAAENRMQETLNEINGLVEVDLIRGQGERQQLS